MGKIKVEKYSDIMTPEEVSEFLRCSQNKVYKMLEDGEIPGVKIAGGWRILKSNLLDMFRVDGETAKENPAPMVEVKSSTKIAIGAHAKERIINLLLNGKISSQEINNLTDFDYCKNTFKANFPILKIVDNTIDLAAQRKDSNGYSRYYKDVIAGKYLLSSQWYDYQKKSFDSWFARYK